MIYHVRRPCVLSRKEDVGVYHVNANDTRQPFEADNGSLRGLQSLNDGILELPSHW